MTDRWPQGGVVLYRYGRHGRSNFVRVGRVISDDAEGLALWIAPGAPQVESVLPDGRDLRALPVEQRALVTRARRLASWRGAGIVKFVPPAGEWSVWWFFNTDGSFARWYGNLESPHQRWEHDGLRGIDTADRALDVLIAPDRTCEWKDEDEFAAMTGLPGRWTAAQAPSIRATGARLIALAGAAEPPFDGRYTDFRPDPSWSVPTLPAGWDEPHRSNP